MSDMASRPKGGHLVRRGLHVPRTALQAARDKRGVWAAVRQARRARSDQATVRICWDLDNTLVNSGKLLHEGRLLNNAIVEAEPVSNMLELYNAIRVGLPQAEHFILSARLPGMRAETLTWLERYSLIQADSTICFVPSVQAKRNVWEELARGGALIIVDDLSYNHEADQVSVYEDLVDVARHLALVYVGLDDIAAIAVDPAAVHALVSTIESVLAESSS